MSSSEGSPESWISSFCSLVGHEYFAEVSEDFIEDDFNLTGLQSQVSMYKEALEMILDVEPEDEDEDEDEEEDDDDDDDGLLGDDRGAYGRNRRHMRVSSDLSVIESSAELLYGLIHQRYITSRPGIQQMAEKYDMGHFGTCPRVHCNGCKVLPVGRTDTPGQETVKLFCPMCLDIYTPPSSRFQSVDGAFFGTTFGSLFLMTFPDVPYVENNALTSPAPAAAKSRSSSITSNTTSTTATETIPPQPASMNGANTACFALGLGKNKIYHPKIYGFKVSERARSGPRMTWLREKPANILDLDEVWLYRSVNGGVESEAEDDGDTDMPAAATTAAGTGGARKKKYKRPPGTAGNGQTA